MRGIVSSFGTEFHSFPSIFPPYPQPMPISAMSSFQIGKGGESDISHNWKPSDILGHNGSWRLNDVRALLNFIS